MRIQATCRGSESYFTSRIGVIDSRYQGGASKLCLQDKLLSAWDTRLMGQPGLPPRVVEAGLLKDIKQVDFVTYIPSPYFRRDKAAGEATKKVAALRNKRMRPKVPTTDG